MPLYARQRRSKARTDALIIALIGVGLFSLGLLLDLGELVDEFKTAHEHIEVDEIFFAI